VLGDPLELVASGPTVPTVSRPDLALEILERLAGGSPVAAGVPEAVVEWLTKQNRKKPEPGKPDFRGAKVDTADVVLLGNLRRAGEAAAEQGGRLGFPVQTVMQSDPHETVGDASVRIVAWIREQPAGKRMLVDAGEPILRLGDSPGRGGRNQHLVLEVAKRLLDEGKPMPERWCFLSAGTDGEDGNTAAAGGIIDGNWMDGMKDRAQEIDGALEGFDSATLLATTGGQLVTGPTGTNVGDLRIVVLE
jgi:glycerate 2-kinase